jgi:hypothetical protein
MCYFLRKTLMNVPIISDTSCVSIHSYYADIIILAGTPCNQQL